jgi:hypothetical protein
VSYENVDIYVVDNTPQAKAIPGVTVKVMSEDGKTLYTLAATDADGYVGIMLPSEMSPFQVRLFKPQWQFTNPQFLEVVPAGVNIFDVVGVGITPPVPTDSRLCTAFGFFRDLTGKPQQGVRMYFISEFKPFLLDGAAVMTEREEVITDEEGYAQIDLIRHGMYRVTISSNEDYQRKISIPDQPNVNLPDLLFPVVSAISFSPSIPPTMHVGDPDLQVTPYVVSSDGNPTDPTNGACDVTWKSSDPNVLAVLPAGGILTLRALSAGTAQVIATRQDQSIVRIPDPGITGVPATVVVS